jgi:acetyl esterase/lipase
MSANIDPELVAPMERQLAIVGGGISEHPIPAVRILNDQANAATKARLPAIDGLTITDAQAPGPAGAPPVAVRVYQPAERASTLPALLWIHGGGYVVGSVDGNEHYVKQLVKSVGCLAVAVEYRLAPENPFPAALEDCYAALKWLAAQAAELGVDPGRLAIGGASAGGGLAAGLALLARDRGEVPVAFQLLIYPMLDDRNLTQASDTVPDSLLWRRKSNLIAWQAYLGGRAGEADVSPYAAALRATDLAGLPPTYLPVGELDLFLEENITYAARLLKAGVPTELHVYPGAYHGFDNFAPEAAISQRFIADRNQALRRAFRLG